ncbi:MAG: CoA pyrophosphatase [Bauldia sp.]
MFAQADFMVRLRERLLRAPSLAVKDGDHRLNPDLAPGSDGAPLKEAAVLIPLRDGADGLSVILTRRHAALKAHAGQVAFPGGRIDATDPDALACALREAEEEIGLPRRAVTLLGYLPAYVTGTGFRVVPVLGRIGGAFEPVPNAAEVDAVFDVPLAFLMDPANHRRVSAVLNGVERHFYEMPFGPHYIWGATAGMIRSLYERVLLP